MTQCWNRNFFYSNFAKRVQLILYALPVAMRHRQIYIVNQLNSSISHVLTMLVIVLTVHFQIQALMWALLVWFQVPLLVRVH